MYRADDAREHRLIAPAKPGLFLGNRYGVQAALKLHWKPGGDFASGSNDYAACAR